MTVIVVLVILATMAAFLLGLVVVVHPLRRLRLDKRRHGLAIMAGALAVFIIAGFFLPDVPTAEAVARPATPPPSVAGADSSIRSAAEVGDTLVVDIMTQAWTDQDHALATGDVAQAVGRALQQGAADGGTAPNIAVAVTTTGVDRLGAESDLLLMTVTFARADLMAAQFDNLLVGQVLNLATDVQFGPAGARALLAYCRSDRGREQSRPFCELANDSTPA